MPFNDDRQEKKRPRACRLDTLFIAHPITILATTRGRGEMFGRYGLEQCAQRYATEGSSAVTNRS